MLRLEFQVWEFSGLYFTVIAYFHASLLLNLKPSAQRSDLLTVERMRFIYCRAHAGNVAKFL